MKRLRRIEMALVAALFVSGVLAGSASAITPEFLHEGKEVVAKGFKVKSGKVVISFTVSGTPYKISCIASTSEGKLKSTKEVEAVTTKLTGCTAKKGEAKTECEVKSSSPEGSKEEVVTKELKGRLGSVAKSEAASEVGLLLEPVTGSVYVTLKGSAECLPKETSEVKGSVIGEVTPTKKEQTTGELLYKLFSGKEQLIRKFTGDSTVHELEVFGVKALLESAGTVTYGEKVEVR
jgi:hypothetical protein